MSRRGRGSLTVAALLSATLTGCLGLQAEAPPPEREYAVGPLPGQTPPPLAGPAQVEVAPFGIDPALDRDALVWQRGVELGAFAGQRWARPPQDGLRELVVQALTRAGLPAAGEPPPGDAELTLTGQLHRFQELDHDQDWQVVVELELALVRRRDGAELLRTRLLERRPATQRNPLGVAEALQTASQALATRAAAAVQEALSREAK